MKRHWRIGSLIVMVFLLGSAAAHGAKKPPSNNATEQLAFGVEMAKRGLWSEALFRFKQAERLRPGDPRILNNMAVAHEALGHFERALEVYQQAIKADRTNRELKRNYSRFIEFYRAFKPDQQQGGEAPAEESVAQN
jgi:tetratricopeptide (TPR) repeat protein